MNQDNIKLIATEVMKYHQADGYVRGSKHFNAWWNSDGKWCAGSEWDPCKNWADCGMVIDRMSELGFVEIEIYHTGIPLKYEVTFYDVGREYYGEGETKQEAICKAALERQGQNGH